MTYTMGKRNTDRPSAQQLAAELDRGSRKSQFGRTIRNTLYVLVIVAAVAILLSTLLLPVMKIYGNSMSPTIDEGEIVLALKNADFATGDIIAFYYNNKILVKRVIGAPGDWVDIKVDGTVVVNGLAIEEPYLPEKDFGICDVDFPYQVPEAQYFVLGDHRATSVDSRSSTVGCIPEEQIVGRIELCIWPLANIRFLA